MKLRLLSAIISASYTPSCYLLLEEALKLYTKRLGCGVHHTRYIALPRSSASRTSHAYDFIICETSSIAVYSRRAG